MLALILGGRVATGNYHKHRAFNHEINSLPEKRGIETR